MVDAGGAQASSRGRRSFELDGEQYVAAVGGLATGTPTSRVPRGCWCLARREDGKLPPAARSRRRVDPAAVGGTPAEVALGSVSTGRTARCVRRHRHRGWLFRRGVPDLAYRGAATHAAFVAIVLEGQRAANGMAGRLRGRARADEAEAVRAHIGGAQLLVSQRDHWIDA